MKKTITTIIFLLLTMCGYSQNIEKQIKTVDVSISLVGFGGDYVTNSSGIQAGIEFRLKNNLSMQCDVRYIFGVSKINGYGQIIVNTDKLKGFAVNTEVKKYIGQKRNELIGGYIGGQAILLYTNAYQENHQIQKTKIGLYAVVGWKYIAQSGFLFETSTGLGVQLITSISDDNIPVGYYESEEFPWNKQYDAGTSVFPDLSWNVRIGWRF